MAGPATSIKLRPCTSTTTLATSWSTRISAILADKFEREPELLEIPLRNIKRRMDRGHPAKKRLLEWQGLIVEAKASTNGMHQLGNVLRADDEESRFFKGFAPFPGVLSDEENQPFLCSSRH